MSQQTRSKRKGELLAEKNKRVAIDRTCDVCRSIITTAYVACDQCVDLDICFTCVTSSRHLEPLDTFPQHTAEHRLNLIDGSNFRPRAAVVVEASRQNPITAATSVSADGVVDDSSPSLAPRSSSTSSSSSSSSSCSGSDNEDGDENGKDEAKALSRDSAEDESADEAAEEAERMVVFNSNRRRCSSKKPIVYVYAARGTKVQVRIRLLDPKSSAFTFIYPVSSERSETNNASVETCTWNVTVQEKGALLSEHKNTEIRVPYLFWEADVPSHAFSDVLARDGQWVQRESYVSFLEAKLQELGLEQGDEVTGFITYWVPLMHCYPFVRVTFDRTVLDETAKLSVVPVPDLLLRVYMIWSGHHECCDHSVSSSSAEIKNKSKSESNKANTPTRANKELVVVEWGGSQVNEEANRDAV